MCMLRKFDSASIFRVFDIAQVCLQSACAVVHLRLYPLLFMTEAGDMPNPRRLKQPFRSSGFHSHVAWF